MRLQPNRAGHVCEPAEERIYECKDFANKFNVNARIAGAGMMRLGRKYSRDGPLLRYGCTHLA